MNPTTSLSWSFATLPAGDYRFVAGSDLDGDGVTCEEGDYCGVYPRAGDAQVVHVGTGAVITGLDFRVGTDSTLSGAAAAGGR